MTKRAYPFEIGVLRQFKVHVNTFDCDKTSMKELQSKTLERLFSAQKNGSIESKNTEKLLRHKLNGLNKNHVENKNQVPIKENKSIASCSYCDCNIDDIYKCNLCNELICQACSFADYNQASDEVRMCITCS